MAETKAAANPIWYRLGTSICGSFLLYFWLGHPASFSVPVLGGMCLNWPTASSEKYAPPSLEPASAVSGPLSVQCVEAGAATRTFRVTVRNREDHSLHIKAGHVNLAVVGVAGTDWPAVELPPFEERYPRAAVFLCADCELPGSPRSFRLDLTVPPGQERKFLLQVDAVNLTRQQQPRFYAVGSVILDTGDAELVLNDFDMFGRVQSDQPRANSTAQLP